MEPIGHIVKGLISRRVDEAVNDHTADYARREALLKDLLDWEGPRGLTEIYVEHRILTQDEARPLREFWYNREGWWPEIQPIEHTVRQSLIKAIQLADEEVREGTPRLLIDSYWMNLGDHFEVIITRGPLQITRIMITPSVPAVLPVRLTGDTENIWIIRPGVPLEEVEETVKLKKGSRDYSVDTVRLQRSG